MNSLDVATTSPPQMKVVYDLWDSLDQLSAHGDQPLIHLAERLRELLAADNITWLAAVRVLPKSQARKDQLRGWRLRASYCLKPSFSEHQKLPSSRYYQDKRLDEGYLVDHATLAIFKKFGCGTVQAYRLRDGWIPFAEFRQSDHFRIHYKAQGITDRIWISIPINPDAESLFLIDRHHGAPHFSKGDLILASTILRGIRGFHRRNLLNHGLLIANEPMSPASRRIIPKLLTGMSEKEIAAAVNQSVATTHKYIKAIYSQFGVNSRAAFMSLWLGN